MKPILTVASALILLLTCSGMALAQDAGVESPFSTGVGSRQLGMGGGFSGLADDASAVFYNPAGLPYLADQELSFMHMDLFEGTVLDWAVWAMPSEGIGGFGIAFLRVGTGDIVKYDGFLRRGTFDYGYSQMMFSYGRSIFGGTALGASLKIANQSLDTLSDYGFGFDLGLKGDLGKKWSYGLIARDIIPTSMSLANNAERVPVSLVAGIAANKKKVSRLSTLTMVCDLELTEDRDAKVRAGAEFSVDDTYSLRGGYDRDNASLGAGARIGRVTIDYAFKFVDHLENSHRFSVTFRLGKSIEEQRQIQAQIDARRGTALLADERQRMFNISRIKADQFYADGELDSALVYYYRALAFDETNDEVLASAAQTEEELKANLEETSRQKFAQKEVSMSIEVFLRQARSFRDKKYYPAALDMISMVFELQPNHQSGERLKREIEQVKAAELHLRRGQARDAEKEGRYAEAIELYVRILELDPDNPEIIAAKLTATSHLNQAQMLTLAVELYNQGQYDHSRAWFETILRDDPRQSVAKEYLQKMKESAARPSTLEELQMDREAWQWYLNGLRQMRAQEHQQAIDFWEKVLKKYPNNKSTLDNIEQARRYLQSE